MIVTSVKRFAWMVPVFTVFLAGGQTAPGHSKFLDRALIEQTDGSVAVHANYPLPLEQAIEAIRERYGWTVDYEDPPYESYDLIDGTDPGWRMAHPNAKGVTRVAGGPFVATFNVGNNMSSGSPDEERVLEKVVTDYNASGNPGQFMLKRESADRFSIVGIGIKASNGSEKAVAPVLDTRISLPLQDLDAGGAIKLISQAISEKSPYKLEFGNAPSNLASQTRVKVGGNDLTAREMFEQIAAATRLPVVWLLMYDTNAPCYFINMDIAMEATSDGPGPPRLKPISKH